MTIEVKHGVLIISNTWTYFWDATVKHWRIHGGLGVQAASPTKFLLFHVVLFLFFCFNFGKKALPSYGESRYWDILNLEDEV